MKLVFDILCVFAIFLCVYSEDYYKDETGNVYTIGAYGQRQYQGDGRRNTPNQKFNKAQPVLNFAWKLFKNVDKENFVLSPLSPQILLSALALQTEGDTRKEIKKAVEFENSLELEELISNIQKEPTARELKIANGFFLSNKDDLKESFWDKSGNRPIDIVNVNFTNTKETKKSYREWIKTATKGALKKVDVNISPDTKMLLASALYFKGQWLFAFNSTQESDFKLSDDSTIKVQTMRVKKKYVYGSFDDRINATWASIPYNSTEALVIILPDEGTSLEEVIKNIEGEDLVDLMNVITDPQPLSGWLDITLPKFKLNTKVSLKEPLEKMGIKKLFSPQSELSLFKDNTPLSVDEAVQQSLLEIDEKGSIGATTTTFSIVPLTIQQELNNRDVVVDRPFIAMIVDRKYSVPFFIAKITDPSKDT